MERAHAASIRTRLMLLVLVATLPALFAMLYTASEQRRLDAEGAQADARRQAYLAANDLQRSAVSIQETLLLLSRLPEIRADFAVCQPFLADLASGSPMYVNIAVIGPQGQSLCNVQPTRGTEPLTARTYFQRAMSTREFVAGD